MNGVIFGPWVGEFGWELFSWQAHCRSIARSYDFVITISRPGNSSIYHDFSDIFLPFEPPSGVVDSHMHSEVTDFNIEEFLKASVDLAILAKFSWTYVPPQKIGHPPYDHWRASVPVQGVGDVIPNYRFLKGNISADQCVDIVVHARNRKIRTVDNWNVEKWEKVVSNLNQFSFASIGRTNSSDLIPGTVDYRDQDLCFVTGLLNSAKCIVGPSSGPLHLATLSGCPQVWWTSNPRQNFPRYTSTWNPFIVESSMLQGSDPSVESVVDEILNMCGDK